MKPWGAEEWATAFAGVVVMAAAIIVLAGAVAVAEWLIRLG